jgi:hypothetical protein
MNDYPEVDTTDDDVLPSGPTTVLVVTVPPEPPAWQGRQRNTAQHSKSQQQGQHKPAPEKL